MNQDTRDADVPQFSAAALREWSEHVEIVLRSLAHAMNNRAAALSAVLELTAEIDDDPAATRSILNTEMARVRELASVVRTLGPPRGGAEALSPADAALEAQSVLKMYAEQRERSITIDAASAAPIRVQRWMFVRSLIALGASACDAPGERSTRTIRITTEGDWIAVRADGDGSRVTELSPCAAELARAMGGEPEASGFRLPTLAVIRQREGR